MNVKGRKLLMTKPDGHQRGQKMRGEAMDEQALVISKNVLAAETYLAKLPIAGVKIQGTDLSARPAGNVNADEAADAADRTMAESSCDQKEKRKENIKASIQEKER
jgi:hypothetical protein